MKHTFTAILGAALLLTGSISAQNSQNQPRNQSSDKAAAQGSKEVTQDTKTTTSAGTAKVSTDTVYGKIESYDPNKSLNISTPGKTASTKSFDLTKSDETRKIASNLKVGDWVSVMEKTDNNGHKTLTIEKSTKKAASRVKR